MRALDLTGAVYGRLTVVGLSPYRGGGLRHWICECSCGQTSVIVSTHSLRNGHTRSCGCLFIETTIKKFRTHGKSKSKTYRVWQSMHDRCRRKTYPQYKDYGGRGIKVCRRWSKFENFLADMGESPEGMFLDRKKNNRGYSKKNCRWATREMQNNNTRSNRHIKIDGVSRTVTQWERYLGYPPGAIHSRLSDGWSERTAVLRPLRRKS